MKKYILLLLSILFSSSVVLRAQHTKPFKSIIAEAVLNSAPVKLIPFPKKVDWGNDFLEIRAVKTGDVPSPFKEELKRILTFYAVDSDEGNGIPVIFTENDKIIKEAYHLRISKEEIKVESGSEAGFFYALQTLRQLIQTKNGNITLPVCNIEDAPAFPVRGYMIDVGRNFQSLATLKKQLDIMAMYKMNIFHWHLTDRPAWRIESKKYPELTAAENHRPGRDPGMFYSYQDIRELIAYARKRHISIIPEIDMPGHSDSFVKSTGVRMESQKGMEILENVLNEFFQEIPAKDCPIIHLGSDEVRISNPDEFISRMVRVCENNGRKVMIWNPGLKANNNVIRQTWQTQHVEKAAFQEIDSWNNYINNGEPMTQIQRLFFKPIGYPSENEVIGGILCLWPDVNLDNEVDAFRQNPVYPSLLTYAWKTWTADIVLAPEEYYMTLPPKGSAALSYFTAFEEILLHHKNVFFKNEPFPYFSQNGKVWKVIGLFKGDEGDAFLKKMAHSYHYQSKELSWKNAIGNTLVIKDRFHLGGYFPEGKKGETAYALTYIRSDKDRIVKTLVGFETPMRANRTYTGIPDQGKWDVNGGTLWINDEPLPAPEWQNPGWRPSKSNGWGSPEDQETPWADEELYWTRNPVEIALKKGWNKVLVKIPSSTDYQNWMFSFIPLNMQGLTFSINPYQHSAYYYQRKTHFEALANDKDEIIFIGDSITDGGEWSEMFEKKNVKNRGISGDVTQGVLDRLEEVTESMPKKIFLMIGVNDLARGASPEQIIENTRNILENIQKASPETQIFLQSLLPVNDFFGKFNEHTSKKEAIKEVNLSLQKLASGKVVFINLYENFVDKAGKLNLAYSNDGLHLNGEGYQLWATLIKKYL
jgi:lysophospholipase L1-like esterase